jgi:EAL domain-containing protein (putative c-di-GMP-specific phosphodiesterase class I)
MGLALFAGLAWRFQILFPWIYFAFALAVVHACQLLVEHAADQIEPEERRSGILGASMCMGCLIWALDLGGYLLYPWARQATVRLGPALLALVLMLVIARAVFPMFVRTLSVRWAWLGAALASTSVLVVHVLVASAFGARPSRLDPFWLIVAFVLCGAIAAGLAIVHRGFQLSAGARFRVLLRWTKLLAAGGILLVHRVLCAGIPLQPRNGPALPEPLGTLVGVGLFAAMVGVVQTLVQRNDRGRRDLFDQAHALLRSRPAQPAGLRREGLRMVAERVEVILDSRSFELHFQPILSIVPGRPGVRFEALMRAGYPDIGAIPPETFFLACDRRGITPKADRIVLESALAVSRDWFLGAHGCHGVAVNVDPQTLLEPGFVAWLGVILDRMGLPDGWLQLEITEHAMVATAEPLAQVVQVLAGLGVQTHLDDFGTGFSSLGLLPAIPVSGIKLDRSLLSTDPRLRSRQVILEKMCQMTRELGLEATVEGIETREELELVKGMGATSVQGFHLGRPMPASKVAAWLECASPSGRA